MKSFSLPPLEAESSCDSMVSICLLSNIAYAFLTVFLTAIGLGVTIAFSNTLNSSLVRK
jgi:hypothetical protein